MSDARVVLTTAGSAEEARRIAHALVEQRLAACVNIVPQIESIYRWQGKVETAAEWLLVIKTTFERFSAVRDALAELHSYDVPECICLAVESGAQPYLDWLQQSTSKSSAKP
jgi:periplasmic divalent cation tolerance protein